MDKKEMQEIAEKKVTEMFEQKLLRDLVHKRVYEQKFMEALKLAEEYYNKPFGGRSLCKIHEYPKVPRPEYRHLYCPACDASEFNKQISRLQAEKGKLENWLKLNEFEPDNYSKKPRMIEKMIKVSTVIKKWNELKKTSNEDKETS